MNSKHKTYLCGAPDISQTQILPFQVCSLVERQELDTRTEFNSSVGSDLFRTMWRMALVASDHFSSEESMRKHWRLSGLEQGLDHR